MKRNRARKGYSLSGNRTGGDKSEHRNRPTERGALTSWRPNRERLVRTKKETDRARGTHRLETASGRTSQDQKETDRAERTHSLETASGGASRNRNNPTERGVLTSWRQHREEQVMTRKESDQARGTHKLGQNGRSKSEVRTQKETDRALTSWGQHWEE